MVLPRQKVVTIVKTAGADRAELGRLQVDGLVPDGPNRITIVADGPQLEVYINGQKALAARDEALTGGQIGLGARIVSGLGETRVAFDFLRVANLR